VAAARSINHDERMVERGIEQRPTNVVLRRVMAIVLAGLVVVAVPAVLVARRNPWHYVYLMPFGRTPVVAAVVIAAPVLLGVAAWLVLRPALARAVAVVATVLALAMDLTCFQFSTAASLIGFESDGDTRVVAVSPGGSFEVVLLQHREFMTGFDILRIRSRAGLRSREADQDVACFARPFDPVGPEGTFDAARFLSDREIEVRTEAGEPWTTTFDPHTLLAASTLSYGCQVGNEARFRTEGYGGHPMKVHVDRRQPAQVAAWLGESGFTVEAQMTLTSAESPLGGIIFARR
jgi:hypothetical protein